MSIVDRVRDVDVGWNRGRPVGSARWLLGNTRGSGPICACTHSVSSRSYDVVSHSIVGEGRKRQGRKFSAPRAKASRVQHQDARVTYCHLQDYGRRVWWEQRLCHTKSNGEVSDERDGASFRGRIEAASTSTAPQLILTVQSILLKLAYRIILHSVQISASVDLPTLIHSQPNISCAHSQQHPLRTSKPTVAQEVSEGFAWCGVPNVELYLVS